MTEEKIKKIVDTKISFDQDLLNNDKKLKKDIFNKNVLVIGGAGTIGSNYIKELLYYKPRKIVIVDINENALTELTRDLRSSRLIDYNPEYITYPVNLLSETFDKIFFNTFFHIVANFSAHKHVRSEKDSLSIEALIKNNVYGAIKLLRLCEERKPNFFFSVSTDKATNPVNVMGASKALMEKIIISKKNIIRVSTARFANVAFSNGSLLDGFIKRVNKNQPLSCPDDIKRFFVTPKQSGQICLLATFLGESGNIFFPKLNFENDQIYFKEIAMKFLNSLDLNPIPVNSEKEAKSLMTNKNDNDYPILFFKSNTSGEKKYEEFYSNEDVYELNEYNSLGKIITENTNIKLNNIIDDFDTVFNINKNSKINLIKVLQKYISNFNHVETGKNLDQKM